MLRFQWLQVVQGATTYGMELLLTGSADYLTTELAQAELIYTRSPGYDGTDAIQVLLNVSSHQFAASLLACHFVAAGCV